MYPKNSNGNAFAHVRIGGAVDAPWIRSGEIPLYQNIVPLEILAKFPIPPSTDLRLRANVDTGTSDITIIYEMLLIDKALVGM